MVQRSLWAVFRVLVVFLLLPVPSHALLSDPPHLVFGTITQEGVPVLTGTVSAVRSGEAAPVALHEMGSVPALGGMYVLRIPMDSVDPRVPGTCRIGDVVSILVGDRETAVVTVGNKGALQRRDLLLSALHEIVFTDDPHGTPEPVASGGMVTVAAVGQDSSGHNLTYTWSASCPGLPSGGTFADAALPSTSWYAPPNLTGSAKACTITVAVADGHGLSIEGSFQKTVSAGTPGTHTISFVSGPGGTPNPVASGAAVALSVIAQDSLGHALGYYWVAACPSLQASGTFDDPTSRTPVWTAPPNTTTTLQNCNIMVTAADGLGLSAQGFYLQGVRPPVHAIVVTDGPAGTPNPVSSGGLVNLGVSAQDTMGHPIGYSWSSQCTGLPGAGSFSNPTLRNPVWTSPVNDNAGTRQCAIRITLQDGLGVTEERSYVQDVLGALPLAVAAAEPPSAACAAEVDFTAAGSSHPDPAHRIVAYEWDFEYDGSRFDVEARTMSVAHAYGNLGEHTAALRVVDDCKPPHNAQAEVVVNVLNRPPQADAGGPYAIAGGDPLPLDANLSEDPDKGCGDDIAEIRWDLDDDGEFDDAAGAAPQLPWEVVLDRVCGGTCDPDASYPLAVQVIDNSGLEAAAAGNIAVGALDASVKLTSPNGDEMLGNGSVWPVSWVSQGHVDIISAFISFDGGRRWTAAVPSTDASLGTADFTVPETNRTTQHKSLMRIAGFAGSAQVGLDTSDRFFAVGPLDVRSPEQCAVLVGGDPATVTWDRFSTIDGVASAKIMYTLNGGGTWKLAGTVEGNPGSFDWDVPALQSRSARCKVRVILTGGNKVPVGTDTGDGYFTILGALDITAPEMGDLVYGGTSRAVTWQTRTSRSVATTVIRYSLDGGKTWKIAGKIAGNPGIFSWNVPVLLTSKTRCRLKVTLLNKSGGFVAQDSGEDFFTVLPRP